MTTPSFWIASLRKASPPPARESAARSAAGRLGKEDRWFCACGHEWNTFDAGGICPACLHHWTETQSSPVAGRLFTALQIFGTTCHSTTSFLCSRRTCSRYPVFFRSEYAFLPSQNCRSGGSRSRRACLHFCRNLSSVTGELILSRGELSVETISLPTPILL